MTDLVPAKDFDALYCYEEDIPLSRSEKFRYLWNLTMLFLFSHALWRVYHRARKRCDFDSPKSFHIELMVRLGQNAESIQHVDPLDVWQVASVIEHHTGRALHA